MAYLEFIFRNFSSSSCRFLFSSSRTNTYSVNIFTYFL